MSFLTEVFKDYSSLKYFVRLSPKKNIAYSAFTLSSGSVYYYDFPHIVDSFARLGVAHTLGTSASLSAGQFYYDASLGRLYMRKSNSAAPISTDYFVISFRIHISSEETNFYSDPTDNTSAMVFWEGSLVVPPTIKKTADLKSFGFFPLENTSLSFKFNENLQKYLYDVSFFGVSCEIFGLSSSLKVANISSLAVYRCDNISLDNSKITVNLIDRSVDFQAIFEGEYFSSAEQTGNLDPAYDAKPIRKIFGFVHGFVPVNVDYEADAPTTSTNRDWIVTDVPDLPSITANVVDLSLSSQIGIDQDGEELRTGDAVWLDFAAGTDQYKMFLFQIVHGASSATLNCEIASGASPWLAHSLVGATLKKSFVQRVYLFQNSKTYELVYGRDYLEATFDQNTTGFSLKTTAEANVGATTFDPNSDYLFCDVEGTRVMPTIGGIDFGGGFRNSTYFNSGVDPAIWGAAVMLYSILKDYYGMDEADIDTDSFLEAQLGNSSRGDNWEVGFAVPLNAEDAWPTYKEVIDKLLLTGMLNGAFDNEGKFTISQIIPTTSSSDDLLSGEVSDINTQISYDEITKIRCLTYFERTIARMFDPQDIPTNAILKENYWYDDTIIGTLYRGSNEANYLHETTKILDIETYLSNGNSRANPSGIQNPWDGVTMPTQFYQRMAAIYGDRSCITKVEVPKIHFDKDLFDVVNVASDLLPGKLRETTESRDLNICSIEKDNEGITIELDDLRGVNENSGSW